MNKSDDSVVLKISVVSRLFRWTMPKILASVPAVFLALPAFAVNSEVRINPVSDNVFEITGGARGQAWRLQYGKGPGLPVKPLLAEAEGSRAYLSDGTWLRMIDTWKGVVVGRWHFPGHEIVRLTPRGNKVEVEVEEKSSQQGPVFRRVFLFDPSKPAIPYWPSGWLLLYRIPLQEAQQRWPSINLTGSASRGKLAPEEARRLLPSLEEAVRRDPATLWFRMALGKVLWDLGDPRGSATFRDAVKLTPTDYTELLPVSSYLDSLGETQAARDAFERGYQDFWQRGNDPRMFMVLIGRLFLTGRLPLDESKSMTKRREELIERGYKLQPYGESAELAWQLYADYLQRNGRADDARVWRERARETRAKSLFVNTPGFSLAADRFLLLCAAGSVAVVLYFLVLYMRYLPQQRLAKAAKERAAGFARGFSWLNAIYWDRRQRVAFFSMVVVSLFSAGMLLQYLQGILRWAAAPISFGMGSFAGPVTTWYLESRLPQTPERDLLLAIAYQQGGENEKAARLYRSLPQFAESWNNLGVILKNSGKETEARQAFERALEINPGLAEAVLNLGRAPQSFWTELHQKYVSGRPMLAPPERERMENAFLGGSPRQVRFRALLRGFSGRIFYWIGRLAS